MLRFRLLRLCAWHLSRWCLFRTLLKPNNKQIVEPEWTTEIITSINHRFNIPFQLISMIFMLTYLVEFIPCTLAIMGSLLWWLIIYMMTPGIHKANTSLDKVICLFSFILHYWNQHESYLQGHSFVDSTLIQVLCISSIMISGVLLMDLCMDLFGFYPHTVNNELTRTYHYYTMIFQVRINPNVYLLLCMQPLSALYCFVFMSLPIIVLSFSIIFTISFITGLIWNILAVDFYQYSTLKVITPGTKQPIPSTLDYLLFYRCLTVFHGFIFVALITTAIIL